jgi:hypothetical protein
LNLGLVAIYSVAAANLIISIPLIAYAVSQYDTDGFTVFPTKSREYMDGYRTGAIQANKDVQNFEKLGGIDAHQDKIKCPENVIGDKCLGFREDILTKLWTN